MPALLRWSMVKTTSQARWPLSRDIARNLGLLWNAQWLQLSSGVVMHWKEASGWGSGLHARYSIHTILAKLMDAMYCSLKWAFHEYLNSVFASNPANQKAIRNGNNISTRQLLRIPIVSPSSYPLSSYLIGIMSHILPVDRTLTLLRWHNNLPQHRCCAGSGHWSR